MEAMFSVYADDIAKQQDSAQQQATPQSIAELKAYSEKLPRAQLQRLAQAQLEFFEIQTKYGIRLEDLPLIVYRHNDRDYLYKGNDAYHGFLLWQQSKR